MQRNYSKFAAEMRTAAIRHEKNHKVKLAAACRRVAINYERMAKLAKLETVRHA